MNRKPLVIAHRGASAHAPENTLASLRLAMDSGSDGVEFDVRLAADGVPVLFHDKTLRRIASRPAKLSSLTSAQLSRIDAGSWFNAKYPKRARKEYVGEKVPTLAEALNALTGTTGPIYVELKCNNGDLELLTMAVCDVLRGSPLLPRVILKSFRLGVIPETRILLPELRTAALFEPKILDILRRRRHIISLAREFGASQISLHYSLATRNLVSLAADAGIPVAVWTVNDPRWLARCSKLGVSALITNYPERFIG